MVNGNSGRKRRIARNVLFAAVPFVVVAVVTLIAYPGLRPTQQWLTAIACACGAVAAFEARRRMDAMLRALARDHDAVLPATNLTGGSPT